MPKPPKMPLKARLLYILYWLGGRGISISGNAQEILASHGGKQSKLSTWDEERVRG